MHFRTELHPEPADYKLSLASKVVTVGSCFSDVIGNKLEKYKIETLTNPFGTIFNPLSACKLLQICAGADVELADSFVQNNGRWYSYDFHSSFSGETEEELYEKLDEVIVKTRRFLKQTNVLILTLGTANIFRQVITGETVANCHKLPAHNFTRETLLPEEIINTVAETHSLLRELNPNLKLVLTVSPVRHIKDTLELNSVSKSVLRLAAHFLSTTLPNIAYFPAFELLIDDLRDYRFYKEDMLHPTSLAENYIWEKFTGAYFENSFLDFAKDWDKILRAKEHKPFHLESPQHQAFIQKTLEKLRTLQEQVNVSEEIAFFENQLVIAPEPVEEPDSEEEDEEEIESANRASKFLDGLAIETLAETAEKPELADAFAVAAVTAIPTLAEDGLIRKKKKKKPRKKKKKPLLTDEHAVLLEVGTAPVPAEFSVSTISPEAETRTEEPEITDHAVEHYGETLSEVPAAQIRPIVPAKSKSAKRRESRRKKKNLTMPEQTAAPETSEELAGLLQNENTAHPNPAFLVENATVSAEKTAGTEEIKAPGTASKAKSKKPAKPRAARSKKSTFPDLFVSPEENAFIIPEPINAAADLEVSTPVAPSKPKGRKPKAAKLFVTENEVSVPEVIAVPFVPVSEITDALAEPNSLAKAATGKKPAGKKTVAKPANLQPANIAEEADSASEKVKKPTKRRAPVKAAAAENEKAAETKPVKKPGRKKKTTPES